MRRINAFARSEILAHAFHKTTGRLAPYKDSPAACGPVDEHAAFDTWLKLHGPLLIAILSGVDEFYGDEVDESAIATDAEGQRGEGGE